MRPTFLRVRKPTAAPLPDARVVESERDFRSFELLLDKLVRSDSLLCNLTRHMRDVGLVTARMVLWERREPTRAEIAAEVSRVCGPCSLATVERAHHRLRDLGLMTWAAQYDIGSIIGVDGVRRPQARRRGNLYAFHLPVLPALALPRRVREAVRREHSCDREKPVFPNEPQRAGVNPQSLILSLTEKEMAQRRVEIARIWEAEKPARHAKIGARRHLRP